MLRSGILKIENIYRKNKDDFRALFGRYYPQFVYKPLPFLPAGEIAVFAFHTVDPDYLERQLQYLKENGYQTLNATELLQTINGTRQAERNTVVLTFDDGRGSLWSVAYPLLEKYDMKAIAFIVSGAVPDDEDVEVNQKMRIGMPFGKRAQLSMQTVGPLKYVCPFKVYLLKKG